MAKSFRGVGRRGTEVEVLRDFSLSISPGEFVTVFGPNACGKSTLLFIISGLLAPDTGHVKIAEHTPDHARIGFVFQHNQSSLLPWRSNLDNVGLPLELSGVRKRVRVAQVKEFLEFLGIEVPHEGYPYQLSGGQQQLLCIARALISDPDVVLMDEPFNQLDYQTRVAMNEKLQEVQEKTGKTTVFVSHDLDEALLLADRCVLLTRRPAAIARVIDIHLSRPRLRGLLKDDAFFELKKGALATFERVIAT